MSQREDDWLLYNEEIQMEYNDIETVNCYISPKNKKMVCELKPLGKRKQEHIFTLTGLYIANIEVPNKSSYMNQGSVSYHSKNGMKCYFTTLETDYDPSTLSRTYRYMLRCFPKMHERIRQGRAYERLKRKYKEMESK